MIAEDEPRLARFLEKGLRAAGYTTTVCSDGVRAGLMARDGDFDLLILDLGLPRQDGLDVLKAVRQRPERLPVLVLTARARVEDAVAALEGGADDYVTKPFIFDELLARVRARVRSGEPERHSPLRRSDLQLDVPSRRVSVGDARVALTEREFALLEMFLRHPGEVLSRDQIRTNVWGATDVASNIVEVYISSLRRKLGAERFETIRGLGYRMPGD